jgi:hypothetical protein
MARLPCMAEQDLDVQKWLENAADEHMRTKPISRLHEPLAAKLPQLVQQINVTVAIMDEGAPQMVAFTAVGIDGSEFTTSRLT